MEVWAGLVGILMGGVIGSIGTFITTKKRMSLEHELSHDRELRNLRLPHYQRLYRVSESIPREWRRGQIPSRPDLVKLREQFHGWFFGKGSDPTDGAGGLFLTAPARDVYFKLMNELQSVADSRDGQSDFLSREESTRLRQLASELRHQLVHDLGTAEEPLLRWTRLGPTLAPPTEAAEGSDSITEARADWPASGRTEQYRQAWEDHQRRQEFEHQLIDRKTVWLLTSQSLLFAAYGLTFRDGSDADAADQFRRIVQALGITLSAISWIGVLAVINSKRLSWKDYQRHFQAVRPAFVPASAWVERSPDGGLPWGVRTPNTRVALAPDTLLPLVFIAAWAFMP
jgi:hypothetical protein